MDWNKITAIAIAVYFLVKNWLEEMAKILEPVIEEAEKQAQDGLIDKADRKKLVMMAIESLRKAGKIKLSPITRLLLPFIVNLLASKLPDFNITKVAKTAITAAIKEGA